jgi:hypothetical protein
VNSPEDDVVIVKGGNLQIPIFQLSNQWALRNNLWKKGSSHQVEVEAHLLELSITSRNWCNQARVDFSRANFHQSIHLSRGPKKKV